MDRRRAYQQRNKEAGLCWLCSEPAVRKPDGSLAALCKKHLLNGRRRARKAYEKKIGRKPRKRAGRPPIPTDKEN